jgi:integrase
MTGKKLDLGRAVFHGTDYIGVTFIESTARTPDGKKTKTFYIRYRDPEGRQRFEKAGKRVTTAAKAAATRAARSRGSELPNEERRTAERAAKAAATVKRWTFSELWAEYKAGRPGQKRSATDETNFTKYLLPSFGDKEPREVVPLDVDRLRLTLTKKGKEAGTVKNVLELLRRLSNFAGNKCLCAPLPFRVPMPKVNNIRTEDLNAEQTERLLKVLRGEIKGVDDDGKPVDLDPAAREMMLLALLSGMRRGEIFRLKWDDVDTERGFLTLRDPKSGTDERIPMSDAVRELLEARPRTDSPFVFPGRKIKGREEDRPKVDAAKSFRAIRKAAGLPDTFRPMHGLRHAFASNLASSGEVDLYTLQRLLTHKSSMMTQRYAHLRDDTMKRAANVAGRIVTAAGADAKGKAANQ